MTSFFTQAQTAVSVGDPDNGLRFLAGEVVGLSALSSGRSWGARRGAGDAPVPALRAAKRVNCAAREWKPR